MGSVVKSVGSLVGIGPDQNGKDSGNAVGIINPLQGAQNAGNTLLGRSRIGQSDAVATALQNYGQGQGNLNDAINRAGGFVNAQRYSDQGSENGGMQEIMRQLALDPGTSLRFATDKLNENGNTGRLFGTDPSSVISQTIAQEKYQAGKGFSLQPEDYEAYGQASGNIGRMFGQSENSLAQSLADRGLSSSGIAGQSFAGSQGNKLEQLSQLQNQIAQERMNTNMQRLGQTRQFLSNLAGQQGNEIQNQFGREMSGSQAQLGQLQNAAQTGMVSQSQNLASQEAFNQGQAGNFQQRQDTTPLNIGEIFGTGAGQGIIGGVTNRVGGVLGGAKPAMGA